MAPYFLSQGRHIQQDIPALVAEALSHHPGVECVIADPIGGLSIATLTIKSCQQFGFLKSSPPINNLGDGQRKED